MQRQMTLIMKVGLNAIGLTVDNRIEYDDEKSGRRQWCWGKWAKERRWVVKLISVGKTIVTEEIVKYSAFSQGHPGCC